MTDPLHNLRALLSEATIPLPWAASGKYVEKSFPHFRHNAAVCGSDENAKLIAIGISSLPALLDLVEKADALAEGSYYYREGVEAQDMGLGLPCSIKELPGSYRERLKRLDSAREAYRLRLREVEAKAKAYLEAMDSAHNLEPGSCFEDVDESLDLLRSALEARDGEKRT